MEGSSIVNVDFLICKICTKNRAKYTCPRCSISYCSLACYRDRSHSKCSEKFYRNCCENAIKNLNNDDEKRKQIERMLSEDDDKADDYADGESEGSEEEGSSEENAEDLAERHVLYFYVFAICLKSLSFRVKNIDLTADNIDVEKLLELLSKEEKREFYRQIATGSIYSKVPVWTPWWQSASRKLVASFPDDLVEEPSANGRSSNVKPLSMLTSKAPHASIIFSLAETLIGYAFVSRLQIEVSLRFFNGDHLKEMRRDACDLLPKLVSYFQSTESTKNNSNRTRVIRTSTPSKMVIFSDFSEVIASLQSRLAQNHLACSHNLILLLTDDMFCMLQKFDPFVNRALNELFEIFSHVKPKSTQSAVARHKLKFLMACIGKQDEASRIWYEKSVSTLVRDVEASICEQTMRIEIENEQSAITKSEEKSAGPNWRSIIRDNAKQNNVPLIEEVDFPNIPNTTM
ncbi:unnamed protein product [Rodentolepis nana]|uniref:HIT-type domain-containing protein n=1 Tax=Rodentolepis nana TaxID=102285 RepID=A0A0R3TU73_RODNA|nr:unnamed protein product [Rodentolepis nana]